MSDIANELLRDALLCAALLLPAGWCLLRLLCSPAWLLPLILAARRLVRLARRDAGPVACLHVTSDSQFG
jgi:hypothetical protein